MLTFALAGMMALCAAPAQALTLPMFKEQESENVTISREEYELSLIHISCAGNEDRAEHSL